ncbi:MAG: hypothetical protein ACI8O8_002125 [Oleiphilaceae bacterium]|jgi:hypothetical protein
MKYSLKETLFNGLTALSESSFPKKCPSCNHVYKSAEEYVKLTDSIRGKSGLKASEDDDGSTILELFRNCHCGSTLLDFFKDRRDTDEQREQFGQLLEQLCEAGIERHIARAELLKVKQGVNSDILNELQLYLKK